MNKCSLFTTSFPTSFGYWPSSGTHAKVEYTERHYNIYASRIQSEPGALSLRASRLLSPILCRATPESLDENYTFFLLSAYLTGNLYGGNP